MYIICVSSESPGLSFAFHELEDITDSDGALHIADQMPLVCLFTGNEDDFDLGDATA